MFREGILKWFFNEKLMAKNVLGCSVEQKKETENLCFLFSDIGEGKAKLIWKILFWWTFWNRRQWLRRWNWMLTNDKIQNWHFSCLQGSLANQQIRLPSPRASPRDKKCFPIKIPFSFVYPRKKGINVEHPPGSISLETRIKWLVVSLPRWCRPYCSATPAPVHIGIRQNVKNDVIKKLSRFRSPSAYFIASFRNEND